jgi:hypothetical protein
MSSLQDHMSDLGDQAGLGLQEQSFLEVRDKLGKCGAGYNRDVAKQRAGSLVTTLTSMTLTYPKLEDSNYGRKLFTDVQRMLKFGGNDMASIVGSNFPVNEYLADLRERNTALCEGDGYSMGKRVLVPPPPTTTDYQIFAEVTRDAALKLVAAEYKTYLEADEQKKKGKKASQVGDTRFSSPEAYAEAEKEIREECESSWKIEYVAAKKKNLALMIRRRRDMKCSTGNGLTSKKSAYFLYLLYC